MKLSAVRAAEGMGATTHLWAPMAEVEGLLNALELIRTEI